MPRSFALIPVLLALLVGTVRAAEPVPGVDAAIARGVAFLKKNIGANSKSGAGVLAALAMVKSGQPADAPEVRAVLEAVLARCSGTEYKPEKDHYYTAGLELMLLEAIDPERYRPEMEKLLAYVLAGQREGGAWFYPDQPGPQGDTSITQYAVLGLWAGERAGLDVPAEVWDRMAGWHLKTQVRDGGFAYHPSGSNPADVVSRSPLTAGGVANLLLARLHLYQSSDLKAKRATATPSAREAKTGKKFGVLETVSLDAQPEGTKTGGQDSYTPRVRQDAIDQSVTRAVAWSETRFKLPPDTPWKMYYLYAIERMAALGNLQQLGNQDWYSVGAKWLLANQAEDGSWTEFAGVVPGTSFAILFLSQSTAKMLGRSFGVPELGGGLLIGGRGLPDDLDKVNVSGGNVKTRTAGGPIDELLARLENAQAADVPDVQQAVLEAVRFGDREKLIGQRDRLRRLLNDPRVEVRRTAIWAIGRGGELADVPELIKALSDPDLTVAVEAHNALCVLARRPLAFGIDGNPAASIPENAADAERQRLADAWRTKAIAAWTDWYQRVAPYDERDGLGIFR